MTRSIRQLFAALLTTALLVLATAHPAAAASVSSLKKKLLKSDDFRVRTQAALALGRSGSSRAVKALCKGLEDNNKSVRAASAAALGKLKKGGSKCLAARLGKEKASNVKKMIKKAMRLIKQGASGPKISASTRYYVAIGKTNDKTGRGGREVDKLVRKALLSKSSAVRNSAIAPRGESLDDARKVLRKHRKLDAFKLAPTVPKPTYSGGQLTVNFEVLVYGYPGNNLQGTVSRSATMSGVGGKDVAKENQLIEALAKSAMEQFAQLVAQL